MAVTSRHNKYTSIPDWFSGQSTETATTSPISQTVYVGGSSSATIVGSTVDFKDIPIDNSTIIWLNEQLAVPIDNDKIIIVDGKVTTSPNVSGIWELRQLTDGTNYIYTTYPVVTQLGITMYSGTEGLDIGGIYDGLPIDNTTIYWDIDSDGNRVLKAIDSSGGGVADSVAWADVLDKPSWITDSVPSIAISGVSVSLGGSIAQSALRTALGLGSNAYTSTSYLPSSSYTASDILSKLKTVDGSSSGLDADLLDGKHYSDIINGNVASATKLATARTIWGQLFDGTANVIGTAHIGQNTNGTATIDAFGGNAYYGCDAVVNGSIISTTGAYIAINGKNGNVGIGTTNPSQKLHVVGNILVTGGTTMYSARKLKTIQDERGLSLDELSTIKPTRFTWKDGRDDKVHIGGIADDVMKVLPEVIYKTGEDDTLTMDYGNAAFAIAASLIKPVVNHEERIKVLEEENKRLKEEIEQLKWNIA